MVLSTHAVPFHPGEPDDCIRSFLRRLCWFRHIRQVDRSLWFNEAVSGSLALRLASLSKRGFAETDCSVLRSLDYVCHEYFIR